MFSATKGGSPSGYQINRSVRLRSSASAYLQRNNATTGTNPLKFTVSGWMKRGASTTYFPLLGSATGSAAFDFIGFSGDNIGFRIRNTSLVDLVQVISTAVYRDFSAWYHIVAVYDSANATSTERVKLYVNGVQITAFSIATYPSLNQGFTGDFLTDMQIGRTNTNSTNQNYGDGYITEINFIDGQALTPSSFGETNPVTGVWQPKKYAGTYGTNGFYLNFSDNSAATAAAIGADSSGNGNNWTPNNISVTAGVTYDSMLDVPTQWADGGNGRGNYAVLNPLSLGSTVTLSNSNLTMTEVGTYATTVSSIAMTSGKWYAEMTAQSNTYAGTVGIAKSGYSPTSRLGFQANTWSYNNDGGLYYNSSTLATVSTYTTNDVVGIAFDADNMTITFYKNGVQQGTQYTAANSGLTAGEFYFATGHINSTSAWNFGQRPFAYTPPSGFKALNTLNLPTPTILKGNQYFDATTYTGNGSTQTVTNSGGMQPDMVWLKSRSNAFNHWLSDSVRGVSNFLSPNQTVAEATYSTLISAYNSNGFTLGNDAGGNTNAATYVGWQWKEGATQGFDIVTYTGNGANRTISHNLGVEPKMMIVKSRSSGTYSWAVYHASTGAGKYLTLNATTASTALAAMWNSTAPTLSVFSVGTDNWVNANAATYVAYLFSEVAGFSKFGSYTGNGSTDGTFVYLGFRPRFIMFKRTDATSNWLIIDTARSQYNQTNEVLLPNSSSAEGTGAGYGAYDFLSNGFKPRNVVANETNVNGGTYIFAAFAENPFKNALAR